MPRRILTLLLTAALLAGGGYAWVHYRAPLVTVGHPARGPAVDAVYATGTVEPVIWAKVAPLTTARIVEICDCEGKAVRKGDVLARLDDSGAAAHVEELAARVAFLEKEVLRYRQLVADRTASMQTYERVSSDLSQASAALGVARERLADFTIRAPADGVVLRKDGDIGEVVGRDDVLFWVGQPAPLQIVAEVDEEDIPRVQPGQKALIKADAFPDQIIDGTVGRVTPKGDPVNRNFRVYITLPKAAPVLIGMTVEVNVVTAVRENALLVPAEAVNRGRVFVVNGHRASARTVDTGAVGGRRIEVLGDRLAESDLIVLDPPHDLADGARIRIRPSEGGSRP